MHSLLARHIVALNNGYGSNPTGQLYGLSNPGLKSGPKCKPSQQAPVLTNGTPSHRPITSTTQNGRHNKNSPTIADTYYDYRDDESSLPPALGSTNSVNSNPKDTASASKNCLAPIINMLPDPLLNAFFTSAMNLFGDGKTKQVPGFGPISPLQAIANMPYPPSNAYGRPLELVSQHFPTGSAYGFHDESLGNCSYMSAAPHSVAGSKSGKEAISRLAYGYLNDGDHGPGLINTAACTLPNGSQNGIRSSFKLAGAGPPIVRPVAKPHPHHHSSLPSSHMGATLLPKLPVNIAPKPTAPSTTNSAMVRAPVVSHSAISTYDFPSPTAVVQASKTPKSGGLLDQDRPGKSPANKQHQSQHLNQHCTIAGKTFPAKAVVSSVNALGKQHAKKAVTGNDECQVVTNPGSSLVASVAAPTGFVIEKIIETSVVLPKLTKPMSLPVSQGQNLNDVSKPSSLINDPKYHQPHSPQTKVEPATCKRTLDGAPLPTPKSSCKKKISDVKITQISGVETKALISKSIDTAINTSQPAMGLNIHPPSTVAELITTNTPNGSNDKISQASQPTPSSLSSKLLPIGAEQKPNSKKMTITVVKNAQVTPNPPVQTQNQEATPTTKAKPKKKQTTNPTAVGITKEPPPTSKTLGTGSQVTKQEVVGVSLSDPSTISQSVIAYIAAATTSTRAHNSLSTPLTVLTHPPSYATSAQFQSPLIASTPKSATTTTIIVQDAAKVITSHKQQPSSAAKQKAISAISRTGPNSTTGAANSVARYKTVTPMLTGPLAPGLVSPQTPGQPTNQFLFYSPATNQFYSGHGTGAPSATALVGQSPSGALALPAFANFYGSIQGGTGSTPNGGIIGYATAPAHNLANLGNAGGGMSYLIINAPNHQNQAPIQQIQSGLFQALGIGAGQTSLAFQPGQQHPPQFKSPGIGSVLNLASLQVGGNNHHHMATYQTQPQNQHLLFGNNNNFVYSNGMASSPSSTPSIIASPAATALTCQTFTSPALLSPIGAPTASAQAQGETFQGPKVFATTKRPHETHPPLGCDDETPGLNYDEPAPKHANKVVEDGRLTQFQASDAKTYLATTTHLTDAATKLKNNAMDAGAPHPKLEPTDSSLGLLDVFIKCADLWPSDFLIHVIDGHIIRESSQPLPLPAPFQQRFMLNHGFNNGDLNPTPLNQATSFALEASENEMAIMLPSPDRAIKRPQNHTSVITQGPAFKRAKANEESVTRDIDQSKSFPERPLNNFVPVDSHLEPNDDHPKVPVEGDKLMPPLSQNAPISPIVSNQPTVIQSTNSSSVTGLRASPQPGQIYASNVIPISTAPQLSINTKDLPVSPFNGSNAAEPFSPEKAYSYLPPQASPAPSCADLSSPLPMYQRSPVSFTHESSVLHMPLSKDIHCWTVNDVHNFISNLGGCREYADTFKLNEIDGPALLLLKEDHLTSSLKIKLGPALKIHAKVAEIRANFSP